MFTLLSPSFLIKTRIIFAAPSETKSLAFQTFFSPFSSFMWFSFTLSTLFIKTPSEIIFKISTSTFSSYKMSTTSSIFFTSRFTFQYIRFTKLNI